ncbi:MAG: hypothetical protein HC893_16485 [Chloroflexaceae bacterium]|nr:hypothetical protein [Chloroflexaceae bacterium]
MGHAIRAGVRARPDDVTLQLDWSNAFNSLSRQSMLNAVALRAPQLLRFAAWMYASPSKLWVAGCGDNEHLLWSRSGVRQGDPCGPLYFALSMQSVLEWVQEMYANAGLRVIAYHDDVFLQGPPDIVVQACAAIEKRGGDNGLQLQRRKCTLYSPNSAHATAAVAKLQGVTLCTEGLLVAGCQSALMHSSEGMLPSVPAKRCVW